MNMMAESVNKVINTQNKSNKTTYEAVKYLSGFKIEKSTGKVFENMPWDAQDTNTSDVYVDSNYAKDTLKAEDGGKDSNGNMYYTINGKKYVILDDTMYNLTDAGEPDCPVRKTAFMSEAMSADARKSWYGSSLFRKSDNKEFKINNIEDHDSYQEFELTSKGSEGDVVTINHPTKDNDYLKKYNLAPIVESKQYIYIKESISDATTFLAKANGMKPEEDYDIEGNCITATSNMIAKSIATQLKKGGYACTLANNTVTITENVDTQLHELRKEVVRLQKIVESDESKIINESEEKQRFADAKSLIESEFENDGISSDKVTDEEIQKLADILENEGITSIENLASNDKVSDYIDTLIRQYGGGDWDGIKEGVDITITEGKFKGKEAKIHAPIRNAEKLLEGVQVKIGSKIINLPISHIKLNEAKGSTLTFDELVKGETYRVDSGMGGTFNVKYNGKVGDKHEFENIHPGYTKKDWTDPNTAMYNFTDDEIGVKVKKKTENFYNEGKELPEMGPKVMNEAKDSAGKVIETGDTVKITGDRVESSVKGKDGVVKSANPDSENSKVDRKETITVEIDGKDVAFTPSSVTIIKKVGETMNEEKDKTHNMEIMLAFGKEFDALQDPAKRAEFVKDTAVKYDLPEDRVTEIITAYEEGRVEENKSNNTINQNNKYSIEVLSQKITERIGDLNKQKGTTTNSELIANYPFLVLVREDAKELFEQLSTTKKQRVKETISLSKTKTAKFITEAIHNMAAKTDRILNFEEKLTDSQLELWQQADENVKKNALSLFELREINDALSMEVFFDSLDLRPRRIEAPDATEGNQINKLQKVDESIADLGYDIDQMLNLGKSE